MAPVDVGLQWRAFGHVVAVLAESDALGLAGLLAQAGLVEAHCSAEEVKRAAKRAVFDRDARLRPVLEAHLERDPFSSELDPVLLLPELEADAATALPWLDQRMLHRLAELATTRPGRGGMPPIVPLIGPRGAGKGAAARWLAAAWWRAGVIDGATPRTVTLSALLDYGSAGPRIQNAQRYALVIEGRSFQRSERWVQPSDRDALVRGLESPRTPVVLLALRSPAAFDAFLGVSGDLLALTHEPLLFDVPAIERLTLEAMRGADGAIDEATWREAIETLQHRPGASGIHTVHRLATAVAQFRERGSDDALTAAMRHLAPTVDVDPLDDLMRELDALVGLHELKAYVATQLAAIRENQVRKRAGLEPLHALGHLAFLGPPGTGKTTAARLLGRILHACGALTTSEVIEVGRAELIGEYIGQTAPRVADWVERARGGVLFIDEAYALDGGAEADFGREALAALVAAMENERGRFVVIIAGYQEPTERLFALNEGLRSRIEATFHFPSMSRLQQLQVFLGLAEADGLAVEPGADLAVQKALSADQSGGNARAARSLYDRAKRSRAVRLEMPGTDWLGIAVLDVDAR